jgi:hypothetical protein
MRGIQGVHEDFIRPDEKCLVSCIRRLESSRPAKLIYHVIVSRVLYLRLKGNHPDLTCEDDGFLFIRANLNYCQPISDSKWRSISS